MPPLFDSPIFRDDLYLRRLHAFAAGKLASYLPGRSRDGGRPASPAANQARNAFSSGMRFGHPLKINWRPSIATRSQLRSQSGKCGGEVKSQQRRLRSMLASVAIHFCWSRFRISLMVGEGSDVWVRSTDAAAAMARYTAAISSPGGRSLQVSIARRPAPIIFADTGICSARTTGFTIGVPQVRWHSEPSGLRRPFASRCLSRATGSF